MEKSIVVPISPPTLNGNGSQENTSTSAAAAAASELEADAGRLTSIHVTALDGIVSVNSLFTMATFIGLSMTAPENATTASRAACITEPETVRRLIMFEVLSFTFFLFSSLIAQTLKLKINLSNSVDPTDPQKAHVNTAHLKYCLTASAVGSVLGCTFLTTSIVDFIRVKLGSLSCGGKPVYAAATMVVFVGTGLLVYVVTAVRALLFVDREADEFEAEAEAAAVAAAASLLVRRNQSASIQ